MAHKKNLYKIQISKQGFVNFGNDSITSAENMGGSLGLNDIMTDFNWSEDEDNRNLILTARIKDDVSVNDAFSEIHDNNCIRVT
jgi:hypothetical protein